MKTFILRFGRFAFLAALLALAPLSGCEKNDSPQQTADAFCHGNYHGEGTTTFTLRLFEGRRKSDGNFRSAGDMLSLVIIAEGDADRSTLPEGTFTLDTDGQLEPGDLVPSTPYTVAEYFQSLIDAGFNINLSDYTELELSRIAGYNGTNCYRQPNRRESDVFPVEQASVTITREGAAYNISASATVKGEVLRFTFSGSISVTLQEPVKPMEEGITVVYNGPYYDMQADDWEIRVNLPEREALFLEILTDPVAEIACPGGSFELTGALTPGALIPGRILGETGRVKGSCIGNWRGLISILVDEGQIQLIPHPDEGTCRIDYSLRGSDPSFGGEREGVFTGKLTLIDGREEIESLSSIPAPDPLSNPMQLHYGKQKTLSKTARPDGGRRL